MSANRLLAKAISKHVVIENFRNGYFPYIGEQIKDYFESLKNRISPDLILTHHLDDRHQDHRTLAELSWNTFRDHFILEYEIPKYDGGLGTPNCFIPVTHKGAGQENRKLDAVLRHRSNASSCVNTRNL